MLDTIMNAFHKMVVVVKESPIASMLTVVLMVTLMLAYQVTINNKALDSLSPSPEKGSEHFKAALEINNDINSTLEALRGDLNADRVMIRQFHNGKHDLTGLPFTYILTTYASLEPGIDLPQHAMDSKPLSTLSRTINEMWGHDIANPKCIIHSREDFKDEIYVSYLTSIGTEKIAMCPLTNLKSYPIGILKVGYLSKDTGGLSDAQILLETNKVADKISGYLEKTAGTKEKDKGFLGIF